MSPARRALAAILATGGAAVMLIFAVRRGADLHVWFGLLVGISLAAGLAGLGRTIWRRGSARWASAAVLGAAVLAVAAAGSAWQESGGLTGTWTWDWVVLLFGAGLFAAAAATAGPPGGSAAGIPLPERRRASMAAGALAGLFALFAPSVAILIHPERGLEGAWWASAALANGVGAFAALAAACLMVRWLRIGRIVTTAGVIVGLVGAVVMVTGPPSPTPAPDRNAFGRIVAPVSPSPWHKLSTVPDGVGSATFVDGKRGWVVSFAGLRATDDGGASWDAARGRVVAGGPGRRLPADPAKIPVAAQVLASDAHTIWLSYAIHGGGLLVSRDTGRTWRTSYAAAKDMSVLGFAWPDPRHGFLLVGRGDESREILLRSLDAGHTWRQIQVWTARNGIAPKAPLLFTDAAHGWVGVTLVVGTPTATTGATATTGELIRTADGGASWKRRAFVSADAITVTPAGRLWAVGSWFEESSPPEGWVARSRDDGQGWMDSDDFASIPLYGVFFVDEQRGWISALSAIYGTRDGGKTWAKELTVPDVALVSGGFDVFARAGNRVLAIRDGEIYARSL